MGKPQQTQDVPEPVENLEQQIAASDAIDDEDAPPAAPAADAAPPAAATGAVKTVTAQADLRVVVPGSAAVFILAAGVPRVLPHELAMAAQYAGGLAGVVVSIKE